MARFFVSVTPVLIIFFVDLVLSLFLHTLIARNDPQPFLYQSNNQIIIFIHVITLEKRKKKTKTKWKTREFVGCVFAFVFLNCLTYSNENDTTSSGSSDQSKDPGWLKNMFNKNTGTTVKPGFVPMKSDFNVPTDGLPATTLKSRKAGRSLRWGDG